MTQARRRDDLARNRDEDLKPADPPRPATEPPGAEGSSRTPKTMTDPATGEPAKSPPRPNGAAS
ncbi:MAG TPA: hypothetical protein PLV04_16035 [Phenylobacterium sp.]|uniref:hypothetical protein n=1 Tax=Phenylobacterium sp. TaxID=1871053 RepID=UPI002B9C044A|nr:hypothetical protein [Phenylobacterium sp.]